MGQYDIFLRFWNELGEIVYLEAFFNSLDGSN